jgi:hypothetical protein
MNILMCALSLREVLATHLDPPDRAIEGEQIAAIIETINQLLLPEPVSPKRRITFTSWQAPNRFHRDIRCGADGWYPETSPTSRP